MKIVWNDRSVRWFRNASEFTGYNKELARLLLRHISGRKSLCDLGCGAGLVDMELAPHIESISCVDVSPEAVAAVKRNAGDMGVRNISAICADAAELNGQWDTVMGLFYGGNDFFSRFFHLAGETLILAAHGESVGGFGPEGNKMPKCFDVAETRASLDALGMKYLLEEHSLEYGQPFESREEAADFARAYCMPMSREELEDYLDNSLVSTGDGRFPLYLPKQKKLGIFVVRKKDNAGFAGIH